MTPDGGSQHGDQRPLAEDGDLADGRDAPIVELGGGRRPDTPQPLDGQRVEERKFAVGLHLQQPIGFGDLVNVVGRNHRPGARHILNDDVWIPGNILN